MKLIILLGIFSQTTPVSPQNPVILIDRPVMEVSAQGEILIQFDKMDYKIEIFADVSAETEKEAIASADEKKDKVMEVLKILGGKKEDLERTYFKTLTPIETDPYYRVEQNLVITLQNVNDINKVKNKLMEISGITVNKVEPVFKEETALDPYIEKAREKAVQNLKKKAKGLSSATGVEIISLFFIRENVQPAYYEIRSK